MFFHNDAAVTARSYGRHVGSGAVNFLVWFVVVPGMLVCLMLAAAAPHLASKLTRTETALATETVLSQQQASVLHEQRYTADNGAVIFSGPQRLVFVQVRHERRHAVPRLRLNVMFKMRHGHRRTVRPSRDTLY